MWIKHDEDTNIPEWLRTGLDSKCPGCGTGMENFYLDKANGVSDRCTNRRCPNTTCPDTLAVKISNMADILKWVGIGESTGRIAVTSRGLTNHLQAIPHLGKPKPTMSINTLLRICFIPGLATKLENIDMTDYETVKDFLDNYRGEFYHDILPYHEMLLEAQEFVDIASDVVTFEHEPIIYENVTITGHINNLPDREMFPLLIAKLTKGFVRVTVVGLRKTNVAAVIKEEGSSTTGKVNNAIACGIPVMTSEEYIQGIIVKLKAELQRRAII